MTMQRRASTNAALLLILLGAFALRVYRLDARPIWYDEAFSVFLSEQSFGSIVRGTAADIQPPLYYLLLHAWQGLGEQVLVMRFLSVALSLLSVALAYTVARQLLSRRAAVVAMFLVALAPFQIEYAQELRMYALLEFSLLVYFFAFVRPAHIRQSIVGLKAAKPDASGWDDRGSALADFRAFSQRIRFADVMLLAASGAAALYSQSLAVLTFVVPDVVVLLRRDRRTAKYLLVGQGLALLLFAPWLVVMLGQFVNVQHAYWTGRPGLVEGLQLLLAFTTNQPLPDWFLPLALFVSLAVAAVLALEMVRVLRRRAAPELVLLAALVVVPPFLMFALSYVIRSIFVVRAVIFSSLAFALLLGWLIARIPNLLARRVVIASSLAVVAVALLFQYNYAEFPRPPFQVADAYLGANARSGDVIVHDNKLSFFPMYFYDRGLLQAWLADPPDAGSNTLSPETMRVLGIVPTAVADATHTATRVWFVIFQRAIDEASSDGVTQANLAWFNQHYRQVGLQRFNDLDIYLYER
jgi:mannosyltransferase